MNKLNNVLRNLNFKKALLVYLIFSLIAIFFSLAAFIFVMRSEIKTSFDFAKTSRIFISEGINDKLKLQLAKLVTDSKDTQNAIILNKNNEIIYKVNNLLVDKKKNFQLTPYEFNKNYLQDNVNKDILYRVVPKENIILNRAYLKNSKKTETAINEDFSYVKDIALKKIFLLNYLVNRDTGYKVLLMREIMPIPYAEKLAEIIGGIFGIIILIYWVGLALWVYKDADRKKLNAPLWGLVILITNLAGILVYKIYKQNNQLCHKCFTLQSKNNIFCSNCGVKINRICDNCGSIINKEGNFCTQCGIELNAKI